VRLNAGAQIDAQDGRGKTALNWAATSNLGPIVELLIARGANPAVKDSKGKTAQDYARVLGNTNMVERLKLNR